MSSPCRHRLNSAKSEHSIAVHRVPFAWAKYAPSISSSGSNGCTAGSTNPRAAGKAVSRSSIVSSTGSTTPSELMRYRTDAPSGWVVA